MKKPNIRYDVLWLPNAWPVPFLLMLQEAVELSPVALCHLLTRNRILHRNSWVKIQVIENIHVVAKGEETQSGCLPGEGDRDSDSGAEAHQSSAALAE